HTAFSRKLLVDDIKRVFDEFLEHGHVSSPPRDCQFYLVERREEDNLTRRFTRRGGDRPARRLRIWLSRRGGERPARRLRIELSRRGGRPARRLRNGPGQSPPLHRIVRFDLALRP